MVPQDIDYDKFKKRGFLRQSQEGFFILRTRMPSAGAYSSLQLKKLSELAVKYAKGIIHATVRQGLEVPFIKYEDISEVEREIASVGISTGTSGARLRATTACPGNNWCRQGMVNTFSLADRIERDLGFKCGIDLPHKFKIAISGCPNTCTRPQASEIGLHGTGGGYIVYLGGCSGKTPRPGIRLERIFTEDEALILITNVVSFFKKYAKPKQRLALLIEEFGKENFLRAVDVGKIV